ncbi:transcriptional regulator of acetoin/glycerol metabolism [Amaricoccus macauensis]|uniref:Nif-specific regulatory protein n=1 Tax=Amaricoccus macauensis TaxID=57001 RepID=A0A840SHN1_9RHOB|nr:sigma-54-dependent Fis family transcriptional regulator [Amaricoccus macauensis]MBB5220444.1 transcriptional regulator of acetoin/glycerol metabolism [Amaricoccus macauensis]
MAAAMEHIREVENVALGRASKRDPWVVQSWLRCINEHRLDPTRACEAFILSETELRFHRQQSEELISIARSGLEGLYTQMAGQNYVLLLGDSAGVAVEFLGDPNFDHRLRKAGLYLGAEWSEPRAGTCAIGACIATGEALTIHQTDHFDVTHTPLSCTAAPIYDTRGEFAAVLDISLLSSPIAKASQNLALHMVAATVRRIELANLMAQTRHEWVLRFSRSPDFLDVDPEAGVSLDGSGRVIGMTHRGAQILARAAGVSWRRPELLIGQPLGRFFELGVDDLGELTRQRPTHDRTVVARDGNRLFAHAIEPQLRRTRRAPAPAPVARGALARLGAGDRQIAALQAKAAKLAPTALPILIQGETGTGKEFLARALHEASGRRGPFVAINCAAIPEALIEAELFGHAPGAFTGAAPGGRKGLVEEAAGGTLFLDEIGDMPLALQARLLRVLAEGEVTPIGALRPRRVDLRVISATHRDLPAQVRAGTLREDLYYRLSAATFVLPPLREREDFDWLTQRLLDGRARLSPSASASLRARDWLGNLRELGNALAVAVALCEGGVIERADLPPEPGQTPAFDGEAEALRAVLARCGGNVSEAARQMHVDRTTVHRRMRRLGVAAH